VLAVSNQKGGVGKTTTVVNLAAYFGLAGWQVLVVDNDPQGNATSALAAGSYERCVYSGHEPIVTSAQGVCVIPAGADLADHERRLAAEVGGATALHRLLEPRRVDFDLILIDCPPNLTGLPTNALLAATHLLIPVQCEYYALEGLSQLLAHIETLRAEHHAQLELAAVLLTMADPAVPLAAQVENEVRRHFGDRALRSVIPRDPSAAAAPSHGRSLVDHDPLSAAAVAYLAAAEELAHVFVR
jgi:chromosome partitioning protein